MKLSIIVFGTPTCSWCRKVKDFLQAKGHSFKYIDVSVDGKGLRDMVRKSGQQGVPQLWINNVAVVGFDRVKIEQLLNERN
ncbi:MAG: glutaredoxin domain-containing protein [Candidatus Cloacimonadaceae bacterium]|nr:glutaredoxin domain-containing protein [Candidatus Cloacimonadaceae bacterium]MDP3115038.1 glutaredoxin domain-containing protein [Candidatus Cloacimonadaceae bacterium]